jgi:hypothetical protein
MEAIIMELYDSNVEKLRNLSRPYLLLYVIAKVVAGVGAGMLLANWLPIM